MKYYFKPNWVETKYYNSNLLNIQIKEYTGYCWPVYNKKVGIIQWL